MNETTSDLIYDESKDVDPLGDAERLGTACKNRAKVGGARGSTLLYTYGPGAIMDLPHFTVMPMGLDQWKYIWKRRAIIPVIEAPRLLENVQLMLGPRITHLRPFPWQANPDGKFHEGDDLGVPARVFPQWLRCTGCNRLAPVSEFVDGYANTNPYRPDQAEFTHRNCPGYDDKKKGNGRSRPCVPARYLLVCENGHVDEFPYDWWVHHGGPCPNAVHPRLKMMENTRKGSGSGIKCISCGAYRSMVQAQGSDNRTKLPKCRGRFPHLDSFARNGCDKQPRLMLIGASNLWFPVVQSIIDMPRLNPEAVMKDQYRQLQSILGEGRRFLELAPDSDEILKTIHQTVQASDKVDEQLRDMSMLELRTFILTARDQRQPSAEELSKAKESWEPADLLVPEWNYLDRDFPGDRHTDLKSGLTVHSQPVNPRLQKMGVCRILAVDRLRKVNALIGFTRVDDYNRANDPGSRLVRLSRGSDIDWVPAIEDFGEGIFIQFDEDKVGGWQQRILSSPLWQSYVEAHRRNFYNRFSETSKEINPDKRMPRPRYWLMHTLSHALIKRMALSSGYGMASLSERLYAWDAREDRPASAGILISTTASDSDGTLGGLVALSEENVFAQIMTDALRQMYRCSSDPICAQRVPQDPEDFLHGAACHCCCMLSETSCERANRFLDRRFIVPLPGDYAELSFFKDMQ